MTNVAFSCNLAGRDEPFPHFWESVVGSGHATLALRADWQKQLERCHRELGFTHVRFHGILSDDFGTLVCQKDELIYSFFNSDQVCDFLVSIGMKPFVELSFMPTALASGEDTVFHYRGNITPPKDFAAWETLVYKLARHWVERFGIEEVKAWFFEVWNEPNLKAFWTGSQQDYFKLYQHSARAVKSAHPDLKVGGPATANNAWIPEFAAFCESHDVAYDFVSTHHYPTDAFGKPGDDTRTQLAASHRSVLREQAQVAKSQSKGRPLYYTEWSSSSNPFDDLHDLPYAAAYIIKSTMEARGLVSGYSYWTFSDLFEENYFSSSPFHGGFGLLNIHGIPKPAYRAYELLHRMGTRLLETTGQHATVDAYVSREGSHVVILATNSALPNHPVKTETVTFQLSGCKPIKSATIERIDETHANATALWKEMAEPDTLSPHQVERLEAASRLSREIVAAEGNDGDAQFTFEIPPQGVVCITLEF